MTTLGLHVHNMNGAGDETAVRRALAAVPGVATVEIQPEHRRVFVTFDDAMASADDLRAAVEQAGFEVG